MNNLEKVLAAYHKYLMLRKLAKAEHVPYLVRWVKEFLQFAKDPSTRFACSGSPNPSTLMASDSARGGPAAVISERRRRVGALADLCARLRRRSCKAKTLCQSLCVRAAVSVNKFVNRGQPLNYQFS